MDHSDELIDSVDLINLLSGVVGGGQKSLPCDPGSELPLGRNRRNKGEDNRWYGENPPTTTTSECRYPRCLPDNRYSGVHRTRRVVGYIAVHGHISVICSLRDIHVFFRDGTSCWIFFDVK